MSAIRPQEGTAVFRYTGKGVTEGYLGAESFGRAILGLNGVFTEISNSAKSKEEAEPQELLVKVLPGSIEFWVAVGILGHTFGVQEFGKQFFGEVGRQLALRLFAKKQDLKPIGQPQLENGTLVYTLVDSAGTVFKASHETLELYKKGALDKHLNMLVEPLESGKVEKLTYTYTDTFVEISSSDKTYFQTPEENAEDLDLESEFDDQNSVPIAGLYGQFVTYRALASKYPFSFQAREKQDVYGKKFMPCTLADERLRGKCLDLMKSRDLNILVSGFASRSTSGQYSRIKITSVEQEPPQRLF